MKKYKNGLFFMIIAIVLGLIAPISTWAQTEKGQKEFNEYIQKEFVKTQMPGMSMEIVNAEDVLFAETYGDCTSLDQPFIIGSLSKSMTAIAIMQLVEARKIDLAASVHDYLPEYTEETNTTVKQLLNQNSGIKTNETIDNFHTKDSSAKYEYANTNYTLLGKIIEKVSGMKYTDYLQKFVFDPLDMNSSFTSLEKAKKHQLVPGHRNYFGWMKQEELVGPTNASTDWLTIPSAYVISSTNDMGKYMQDLLRKESLLLQTNSRDQMINDSISVIKNYQYGYGFGIDQRQGDKKIVHGGNVPNYTTYMILIPEKKIGIIAMFNGGDFFCANDLAIDLTYNVLEAYLTNDYSRLDNSSYKQKHLVINAVYASIVISSLFPIFLFRRWMRKNKMKITVGRAIFLVSVHMIYPTLILLAFPLLGFPLWMVQEFTPDAFLVVIGSSIVLYLTGIIKGVYLFKRRRN
ncbi:serine hydrolase domain-containing protein [Enterococcus sp. AZ163]|uniref:serine hydrolase domain-containing protein n=1 Tax=Enterococcus sp. AZ163 TaxID=2774638 RepID=UPI003D2BE999